MKFAGNYIVAKAIFDKAEQMLPDRIKAHRLAGAPMLTEQECRDLLVNTLWDEYSNAKEVLDDFVRKPPFTNQLYHDRRIEHLESQILAMKQQLTESKLAQIDEQFKKALAGRSADWWLHWRYAGFLYDGCRITHRHTPNSDCR